MTESGEAPVEAAAATTTAPAAVHGVIARPSGIAGVLRGVRVERRASRGSTAMHRLVAIAVGLAAAAVYVAIAVPAEHEPFEALWSGTFGSGIGLSTVLTGAAPLILTGLAVSIPYRMGLWNIGGEGQLFLGAWGGAGISFLLPNVSGGPLIALMLVAAALAGAVWIAIPALARAYLGVSEIITTLLLNFVGIFWMTYWVTGPWQEAATAGGIQSREIPSQAFLAPLHVGSVTVHWGLLLGIGLAVVVWLLFHGTVLGYEVRVLGSSLRAGRYAGMSGTRRVVMVMLLGGAMGGLAGAVEMMGDIHRYTDTLSAETGYSGIVVAVLAAGSELAIPAMAILLSALTAGGNTLQTLGQSADTAFALMGLILLLAAMGDGLARYRVRFRPPPPPPPPPPVLAATEGGAS